MEGKLTLQKYVESVEKIKLLVDEANDCTPQDSLIINDLMKAAEIIEAYEDIHFRFPKPTILDEIQFYLEQRFKYGQLENIGESTIHQEQRSTTISYSQANKWKIYQQNTYKKAEEIIILEREFFKLNYIRFLPRLFKSNRNNLKILIDEISIAKELFMQKHMAYRGYIGTVEYSQEDNFYFGKLLNNSNLVLYKAYKKGSLRYSFYEAVERKLI